MARIISQDEADKLGSRPSGKMHPVRVAILTLPKGLVLQVMKTEFTWKKRTPMVFINQIKKKTGRKFTISETRNGLGWLIKEVD